MGSVVQEYILVVKVEGLFVAFVDEEYSSLPESHFQLEFALGLTVVTVGFFTVDNVERSYQLFVGFWVVIGAGDDVVFGFVDFVVVADWLSFDGALVGNALNQYSNLLRVVADAAVVVLNVEGVGQVCLVVGSFVVVALVIWVVFVDERVVQTWLMSDGCDFEGAAFKGFGFCAIADSVNLETGIG